MGLAHIEIDGVDVVDHHLAGNKAADVDGGVPDLGQGQPTCSTPWMVRRLRTLPPGGYWPPLTWRPKRARSLNRITKSSSGASVVASSP